MTCATIYGAFNAASTPQQFVGAALLATGFTIAGITHFLAEELADLTVCMRASRPSTAVSSEPTGPGGRG